MLLLTELLENGIIDNTDVENIKSKIKTNTVSIENVITSLESLKLISKPKLINKNNTKINNDFIYNELPTDFLRPIGDKIANEWDNDYTILNTNKWQVPMQRPPLCINTSPCQVCPIDSSKNDSIYHIKLSSFDDTKISKLNINNAWANDNSK